MILRRFKKNRIKNTLVDPDEIFLDSTNLQNFDRQQFEGRIEKPISKKTAAGLGIFFLIFILTFLGRLGYLQIKKGEAYYKRSENNTLERAIIFAERGIIYDRNKKELAWNQKMGHEGGGGSKFGIRAYLKDGFAHLLGYVSYPAQDKSGNYWQGEFKGIDGLEKQYDTILQGKNGSKIVERDAYGKIHSENIVNAPKRGQDLITAIDASIQAKLFSLIKEASQKSTFVGGAGILLDAKNGEVLAVTSYPEYDPEILSLGKDTKIINGYLADKRGVFIDRTISGLYAPGSIVKPIFALGALVENIINPKKEILSIGEISIPNPYIKGEFSVFKDWKAHGWTNMQEALAVSSDVYFYTIGGGFESQKGLGISNLEKYARLFGVGEKTGIDLPDEKSGTIPSPEWKEKNFKGDPWRIGDTYNPSIGQYGFQVTPMEMSRVAAAIANGGTLISPHIMNLEALPPSGDLVSKLDFNKEYLDIVHEGMRGAVTYGTAVALNVPYVKVAAKTGTAELGLAKNKINSWVIGFFPYENPRYVFTILMESGRASGLISASSIMRDLLDWMYINTPEYLK